mmetsp:Transcript_28069/g.56229  ORF Transcript_28069/g.56229 Transcript_28069/m.56229 type:complete len:205 (+) Transcript_28069:446-1060(+)
MGRPSSRSRRAYSLAPASFPAWPGRRARQPPPCGRRRRRASSPSSVGARRPWTTSERPRRPWRRRSARHWGTTMGRAGTSRAPAWRRSSRERRPGRSGARGSRGCIPTFSRAWTIPSTSCASRRATSWKSSSATPLRRRIPVGPPWDISLIGSWSTQMMETPAFVRLALGFSPLRYVWTTGVLSKRGLGRHWDPFATPGRVKHF